MSVSITFEDALGVDYDLTKPNAIPFGDIQLSDVETIEVKVKNEDANRTLENVEITPVAHPTEQTGTAEDTYESCTLSLSESGPFTSPLTVGNIPAGGTVSVWVRWSVAAGANPGVGFYALQATGEYTA
jgi:hypothetical protein